MQEQDQIPFPGCSYREAREAVERKAAEAVRRAREARPGWSPPPFEPDVVAAALGIEVVGQPVPQDWDALLVPAHGRLRIVCNTAVRSRGRRRFSVAHEIAHSFFREAEQTYHLRARERERFYPTEQARQLERLCNAGAAELLMPRRSVEPVLERGGWRVATVREIARVFGVSLEAAALRLVDLAAASCAVGFFQLALRPSARRQGGARAPGGARHAYRVREVFRSEGFPFLFPAGKSVPDDSVVYRASLCLDELEAVEQFALGHTRCALRVSAQGLHPGPEVTGPPTVCAVFR